VTGVTPRDTWGSSRVPDREARGGKERNERSPDAQSKAALALHPGARAIVELQMPCSNPAQDLAGCPNPKAISGAALGPPGSSRARVAVTR